MDDGKPILFIDFDGTICFDRYWASLPPAQFEAVQELLFGGDSTRVNDWMLGKYSSEEINHYVSSALGIPYGDLWPLFVDDCASMTVSKALLDRLSGLRDRFWLVLITGNMDCFSRFVVPALGLDQFFDQISNSWHEGKHKTDREGEIFADYAAKFNASLDRCVLIDDSVTACAAFTALGGKSCLIAGDNDIGHYLSMLAQFDGVK